MRTQRRPGRPIFAVGRAVLITTVLVASTAVLAAGESGAAVPTGFADTVVISGLTNPSVVQFAADGRIFVGQKNGQVYSFDSSGGSKTLFADLSVAVDDFWDRGLLGLALSPTFPNDPAVYVLYTYDAPPGRTAPKWNDGCPTPPGATTDGCVVSGRLSKLTPSGTRGRPVETVLVAGWCQQFPSHSVGTSASAQTVTCTQRRRRRELQQRRLRPVRRAPTPAIWPTRAAIRRAGAARRSRLRPLKAALCAANRCAVLTARQRSDGTIIRVDPRQGLASHPTRSPAAAIPTSGVCSPRHAKPVPVHDAPEHERAVGGRRRLEHLGGDQPGRRRHKRCGVELRLAVLRGESDPAGYQSANLASCSSLYSNPSQVAPALLRLQPRQSGGLRRDLPHGRVVDHRRGVLPGGSYPASYNGGLFFADHTRNCIWFMPAGANGDPDPSRVQTFAPSAGHPVDLEIGPGRGSVLRRPRRRRRSTGSATPPPTSHRSRRSRRSRPPGPTPLTVQFDGTRLERS